MNTNKAVLERRREKIIQNDKLINDLDNYINTYDRQGEIILNSILSRDIKNDFIKLLTVCTIVLLFVYLLYKYKMIPKKYALYAGYFVISLTLGIIMLRFYKNKNKTKYNLQTKVFNTDNNNSQKTNIVKETK